MPAPAIVPRRGQGRKAQASLDRYADAGLPGTASRSPFDSRSVKVSRLDRLGQRTSSRSTLDELVADRIADQVGGRLQVELAQGGGTVRLDGLRADAEQSRHLLVRPALGDQLDHGLLP